MIKLRIHDEYDSSILYDTQLLTIRWVLTFSYTVVAVFIFVAALSVLVWIFAPKQNQTVWRSSVILCMAMCYLMWAITYLAQLHPLEAPRRSDMRPEKRD